MYHTDDFVRISDNLAQVRDWQSGHGEWTDVMRNVSILCFMFLVLSNVKKKFATKVIKFGKIIL